MESLTEEKVKSTHDTFIIYVGKSMNLDPDQAALVRQAFQGFRARHSYTDDGEMVDLIPGSPCPDTPEALTEFFRSCAAKDASIRSSGRIRCPACAGSGALYYESVRVGGGLTRFRTGCVDCDGKGLLDRSVTFVLRCAPSNLPDKPPTPRQLRIKNTLLAAKKGDPEAMLRLADEFVAGQSITRNLVDARIWYKKAALQGKLAGLVGFHEASRLDSPDYRQRRLLVALAKAVADLGGKVRQDLAEDALRSRGACLARIRTRILSGVISAAFTSRKLGEDHFDYQRLLKVVAGAKAPSIVDKGAEKMEDALRAWILDGEPEKMGAGALAAVQDAAASLKPEAFAVLGEMHEQGLAGPPNPQSAHACFAIAQSLKADPMVAASLSRLEAAIDPSVTAEVIKVFRQQAAAGRCSQTFLEGLSKLKSAR
jgi:TPR repeat protein